MRLKKNRCMPLKMLNGGLKFNFFCSDINKKDCFCEIGEYAKSFYKKNKEWVVGMIFGYVKESLIEDAVKEQLEEIEKHGCDEIEVEKADARKNDRPALEKLKDKLRRGDTVVVERFSRIGRSSLDLVQLIREFEEAGVRMISCKEGFDGHTERGKSMADAFGVFNEFERELVVERTTEGIKTAQKRGRKVGRPRIDVKRLEHAVKLYRTKMYSIKEITQMTGISHTSLYRSLRECGM